ncbi:acyclic terpene utilization AtuA family protein [Dietzia aurantiaca]|uniref:Acyclic terpene utilization AtuA family protein n=1 Tax=Dietzia aurantiaca TaxID=983873 RepID=A0ABV9PRZ6_9ACTN
MTVRIANCSGFLGDRRTGPREMLEGGPVDYLTGDWLAELTMSILAKQRSRDPEAGFPTSFVDQISDVLALCRERGVKIIANAGGVNPGGCAAAVAAAAAERGVEVRIAVVDGDDVVDRVEALQADGWAAEHLDTGRPFAETGLTPAVVNVYLGAWGIVEALRAGADVVITGRVSDASPIVAAAAAHHGWTPADLDQIAGGVVAGHLIECSAQVTGGNYSFFDEIERPEHPGFPIAEIEADGSCVITKHAGTGGAVTRESVIAQLLYEINGPDYANPDVLARFDRLEVEQAGPDRVRVSGAFGEVVPASLKAGIVADHGWSAEMSVLITGDRRRAKADYCLRQLWAEFPRGRESFDDVVVNLIGEEVDNPATLDQGTSILRIAVADADHALVNRFPRALVEILLGGFPGMALTSPPSRARQRQLFWPTLLDARLVPERVTFEGRTWLVERTAEAAPAEQIPLPVVGTGAATRGDDDNYASSVEHSELVSVPLGRIAGSRSGDKGGNATVGIWALTDEAYAFLTDWWTHEKVAGLLPPEEYSGLRLWAIPSLRALGVTVTGWLGLGTASNVALDTQAKGLGEFLRARHVQVPQAVLDSIDPR